MLSEPAAGLSGTLETKIVEDAPIVALLYGAVLITTRRSETVFVVDVVYRDKNGAEHTRRLVVSVDEEETNGIHNDGLQNRQGAS